MSVAKPLLDYVETIKIRRDIRGTGKEFRTLLKYHKRYVPLFAITITLSAVKGYLFTLEPLYTSQIIDKVIGARDVLKN
jgi:hypothetical protein